jgi:hypothetical protein
LGETWGNTHVQSSRFDGKLCKGSVTFNCRFQVQGGWSVGTIHRNLNTVVPSPRRRPGSRGFHTVQNHFLDSGLRRNDGHAGSPLWGKPGEIHTCSHRFGRKLYKGSVTFNCRFQVQGGWSVGTIHCNPNTVVPSPRRRPGSRGFHTVQNHFLDSGLRRNDGYAGSPLWGKPGEMHTCSHLDLMGSCAKARSLSIAVFRFNDAGAWEQSIAT